MKVAGFLASSDEVWRAEPKSPILRTGCAGQWMCAMVENKMMLATATYIERKVLRMGFAKEDVFRLDVLVYDLFLEMIS